MGSVNKWGFFLCFLRPINKDNSIMIERAEVIGGEVREQPAARGGSPSSIFDSSKGDGRYPEQLPPLRPMPQTCMVLSDRR